MVICQINNKLSCVHIHILALEWHLKGEQHLDSFFWTPNLKNAALALDILFTKVADTSESGAKGKLTKLSKIAELCFRQHALS